MRTEKHTQKVIVGNLGLLTAVLHIVGFTLPAIPGHNNRYPKKT
jgi:hypothetical protein